MSILENSAGDERTTKDGIAIPKRIHMRIEESKNKEVLVFLSVIEKKEKKFFANLISKGENGINKPAVTKSSLLSKFPV